MCDLCLLLDLLEIDVGNGILAIKDTSNLLKGRTLGLHVEEVDKDQLDSVPECVEHHDVPVPGQVIPRQIVGLTMIASQHQKDVGGGLHV